ncbi:MAG: aldehyde dehydrogenase [Phycisphaerales bacterium]|nr:aldehyde dehydrogenase [Phycisphaerales bacterium]
MTRTLQSIDPALGSVVGEVAVTSVGEIAAVVARARAAQPAWAELGLAERARRVTAAAEALKVRAIEIGTLASHEMGKPLKEAIGEVSYCAESLAESVAEIVTALEPETLEDKSVHSELRFDPLGVAACITPWNFPVAMPQDVVIPSLLAGNTVLLKPSEKTPLCAQAWAECLIGAVGRDVLALIHGDEMQGKALVQADVNLIAFVGSRAAGKHIMREAAGGLKRLVLELGGKDALIVLDDADLDLATAFAARNCFRNAGQVCVSTERIFVHERVATRFVAELSKRAEALVQGDPANESTQIGPMADAGQKSHVLALIEDAVRSGATVAVGGQTKGNFVRPTVLTGVTPSMRIMQEETFGPVACVMSVKSDDEAVRLANGTPFGLGGAVFGEREHALRVARALDTGMVGINKGCGGASGSPWVGAKESGFGYHSGKAGHRQFAQVRVISVAR